MSTQPTQPESAPQGQLAERVQPFSVQQEAAARKALATKFAEQETPIGEAELFSLPLNRCGAADVAHCFGVWALTPRGRLLLRPFIPPDGVRMPGDLADGEATIAGRSITHNIEYVISALKVAKALKTPLKYDGDRDWAVRIDTKWDILRIRTEDLIFLLAPRIDDRCYA